MATKYEGILEGTEEKINENFFGELTCSYGDKHAGMSLKQLTSGHDFCAQKLVSDLIKRIRNNLPDKGEDWNTTSKQNWRWGKEAIKSYISPKNDSKEVKLERAIAKMLKNPKREEKLKRADWWNQMPIASGLIKGYDQRRAIDLVNSCDDSKSYDFVELKIGSNTPLYALMEILLYGLVYLVLRKERKWLPECSKNSPVFTASNIRLIVLAPKSFYKGDEGKKDELGWLEKQLTDALRETIKNEFPDVDLSMEISCYWPKRLAEWGDTIWEETVLKDESFLASILQDWEPAFAR